jgi:hypothetical protein
LIGEIANDDASESSESRQRSSNLPTSRTRSASVSKPRSTWSSTRAV